MTAPSDPARSRRDRRHGLPFPRRRQPGGVLAPAVRGRDAIAEIPPTGSTLERLYDPTPATPGRDDDALRRLPRRHRPVRRRLLRHLAPRGRAASTPSSACCSRRPGRRSRTPAIDARRALAAPHRRVRRPVAQRLRGAAVRRSRRAIDFYMTTGSGRYAASGPALVCPRARGPEPDDRHRLLLVAGRGPPRVPEPPHAASPSWRSPAAST